jgi:hypothetical protein
MIKKTIFFNFFILTTKMLSYMIKHMNIRILPFVMLSLSLVIFITEAYGRPNTKTCELDTVFNSLPKTFKSKSLDSFKRKKIQTAHAFLGPSFEKKKISLICDKPDKTVTSSSRSKRSDWFSASTANIPIEKERAVNKGSGTTLPRSFFSHLTTAHENGHVFSYLHLQDEFQHKVRELYANADEPNKSAQLSLLQDEFRIDVVEDMLSCLQNIHERQLDLSFYARKFFDEKTPLADKFNTIFGQKNFDALLNDALAVYFEDSLEKSKRRSLENNDEADSPIPQHIDPDDALRNLMLSVSSQFSTHSQGEDEAETPYNSEWTDSQGQLIFPYLAGSEKIGLLEEDQHEKQFSNSAQNRNTQKQDLLHDEGKAGKTRGLVAKAKGWFKTAVSPLFDFASCTIKAVCDSFGNTAYYWWGF